MYRRETSLAIQRKPAVQRAFLSLKNIILSAFYGCSLVLLMTYFVDEESDDGWTIAFVLGLHTGVYMYRIYQCLSGCGSTNTTITRPVFQPFSDMLRCHVYLVVAYGWLALHLAMRTHLWACLMRGGRSLRLVITVMIGIITLLHAVTTSGTGDRTLQVKYRVRFLAAFDAL